MKVIYLTCTVKEINPEYRQIALNHHPNQAHILALFHETLLGVMFVVTGRPYTPLCAKTYSGKIANFLAAGFGLTTTPGSNRKGGKTGRELLLKCIDRGICPALAVDGSSGPRRTCKAGVVDLALKSNRPILPIFSNCSSYWTVPTWDKLKVPKPFSTVEVAYGKPIFPNKEIEFSKWQEKVKTALEELETIKEPKSKTISSTV